MTTKKAPAGSGSQKQVFLHLLMIGFLYASVVAFITLMFQFINYFFPDFGEFIPYRSHEGFRWPLSTLIIIYPAFLFVSWLLLKDFGEHPEKREGRLRKWLLYFTLFGAAITIVIDLIALVFNFLSGELTVRFLLKSASVLIVIGLVFAYYLREIKKEKHEDKKKEKIFVWILSGIVALAVLSGFILTGSPFQQRLNKRDSERISHLQTIQWNIVSYWQQKGMLPQNILQLRDDISGFIPPKDPVTGADYEYRQIDLLTFELCANFETEQQPTDLYPGRYSYNGMYQDPFNENWEHPEGKYCFSRTIDPDRYPLQQKPPIPMKNEFPTPLRGGEFPVLPE